MNVRGATTGDEKLLEQIERLARHRRRVGWLRALLWSLTAVGAGLLFLGWLDLLSALHNVLRAVGVVAVFALAIVVVMKAVQAALRAASARRIASDVDHASETGGEVAAGLGLTGIDTRHPLTAGMAGIAVRRAARITAALPETAIEPARRTRQALQYVVILAAAIAAVALLWPDAFRTELLRLSQPWEDHPPYSRHAFRVRPGDATVKYGESLTVLTMVLGQPAEQLDLVVRQEDGGQVSMPMFEERDGTWRSQLTEITAPVTYWVRADDGWSLRYKVRVIYTPEFESITARITPPAYTHLAPAERPIPPSEIAGLPGTRVAITARSNRPLSRGDSSSRRKPAQSLASQGRNPRRAATAGSTWRATTRG